jgi:hypothetical protein
MNSIMPQNHNHEFPHELAKVTSHNNPTNPRNKSQTNSKWQHNTRREGLRQSMKLGADGA